MNFLPGKRAADAVQVGGLSVPLPAALRASAPESVTVGIRPEHLEAGGGEGLKFDFKVETVEALGADSLVHGRVGDGTLVARVDGHDTPAIGTPMSFRARTGTLYFFDTASGKRLRA